MSNPQQDESKFALVERPETFEELEVYVIEKLKTLLPEAQSKQIINSLTEPESTGIHLLRAFTFVADEMYRNGYNNCQLDMAIDRLADDEVKYE